MAQLVKHLPAVQETWVRPLGWEDPLEKERLLTPVFWPGEFHGLFSPWGRKELDTTKRLSLSYIISFSPLNNPQIGIILTLGWPLTYQLSFYMLNTTVNQKVLPSWNLHSISDNQGLPNDNTHWPVGLTLMLGKIEGRRRRGVTEDEMVGCHHQLNGHESEQTRKWWWTRKPGMLQSLGLQSQTRLSDWTTRAKLP